MIHAITSSPSARECLPCLINNFYMSGLVLIRTYLASSPTHAPGVLTAKRGPLHLRRSQHYQPPPSLRWQRSSLCLPGHQSLPPPAVSSLSPSPALSSNKLALMRCLHVGNLFVLNCVVTSDRVLMVKFEQFVVS